MAIKPDKITKSITITRKLYEIILERAEKENRSFSNMVATILQEYYDNREEK